MKPQEVETIKYDFKRVLKPLCNIILVPTSSRLFGKFISAHKRPYFNYVSMILPIFDQLSSNLVYNFVI